jgi:hypothetical protein
MSDLPNLWRDIPDYKRPQHLDISRGTCLGRRRLKNQQHLANAPVTKHIFQVAYCEEHFLARAVLLRRRGYSVTSVIGNEAAKALLAALPAEDLLIIGHAAPEQTRLDMVLWLQAYYPKTCILALNPPNERLGTWQFNAVHDRPQAWLSWIEAELG